MRLTSFGRVFTRFLAFALISLASLQAQAQWMHTFPYDGTSLTGTWAQVKAFSETKDNVWRPAEH